MPARPAPAAAEIRSRKRLRAITFSCDIASVYAGLACELFEFRQLFRMPPATANYDPVGDDLAVAGQVLADDVDVVELVLLDRDEGGVPDAPGLEAAEFGTPQRHRRIDRRRRDHVRERHAHAQELGHGRHLIEGWTIDAKEMDVRGDGVGIEAVGEPRACGFE